MFKAIYLTKADQFRAELRELDDAELAANTPDADTAVAIEYSTINQGRPGALTNKSPIVRKWPMVPGIDCAGRVDTSGASSVRAGDRRAQRLGCWRDALGRVGSTRPLQG